MATFIINTQTELWKCRRTAAYWLTLAASLFVPIVNFIIYVAEPDEFITKQKANAWEGFITDSWEPAAAFFLPMFVILLCSLVVQVETRNNTWKQVYASPRSYADIFFSKFTIIHLFIVGFLILFNVFCLMSGYLANTFISGYHFFESPVPWKMMLTVTGKMYLAVLALSSIQYWLSLRLRNYIVPMGIGLALVITGLIIIQWEKIIYYPYAYTAVTLFRLRQSNGISTHEMYSLAWFAVVALLAFWDTSKRKERG